MEIGGMVVGFKEIQNRKQESEFDASG